MKKVAIGGGQGFWGDSPDAAIHMIRNADIQYMGCDYLAELTLSIMAKQQLKDPTKGFAPDFTTRILKEAGKEAWDKHINICTNAGGMNINGCVDGIRQWAEGNSMSGYKIGYVTGDNIKDKIPQLLKDGWTFPNFDYDGNFNDILDKIYNCNVYIGHEGIEGCLAEGADVVITGRAADSALFLAPLKYEFGWAADDWDNLARGIMAGHLLECGGQGAGGNYMYDWRNVPRMDELGFPIAELTDDTFEITKAPDCGGIICEQSCKEQFLYEVHDPANYLTPDVNVDISHATITQVGDNRVRIGGVKGKPRPDTLKLCVGYHKGWKTVSMLSFAWPDAYEKAQYCAEVIMKKMQRRGMKADDIHISYIGLNSLHLGVADMSEEALKNLNECVLRIAVFILIPKRMPGGVPAARHGMRANQQTSTRCSGWCRLVLPFLKDTVLPLGQKGVFSYARAHPDSCSCGGRTGRTGAAAGTESVDCRPAFFILRSGTAEADPRPCAGHPVCRGWPLLILLP